MNLSKIDIKKISINDIIILSECTHDRMDYLKRYYECEEKLVTQMEVSVIHDLCYKLCKKQISKSWLGKTETEKKKRNKSISITVHEAVALLNTIMYCETVYPLETAPTLFNSLKEMLHKTLTH